MVEPFIANGAMRNHGMILDLPLFAEYARAKLLS